MHIFTIFNFTLEYPVRKTEENRKDWNWMKHISSWSMLAMLTCRAST